MGIHVDGIRRILSPESFEDFQRRCKKILPIREEIADKFRDLNPPGMEHLMPEAFGAMSWLTNWMRERGGMDLKTLYRLEYEESVEWAYRVLCAFSICKKAEQIKPPPDELIQTKWLCHLSHPPAYMCRADLGFPTTQMLYGKYATTMWTHINYHTGEFDWFQGLHNEDGVPKQYWMIGAHEEIAQHFDQEDKEKLLTPSEFTTAPQEISPLLDRRHLRTGIKMREIPKRCPYVLHEWLRPVRDIVKDLREEMFPKWAHATLYISPAPGHFSIASQHMFWGAAQWWNMVYFGFNSQLLGGLPMQLYTCEPLPPILNTLLALPSEVWARRLSEMFLAGPKGMICDAINKKITSEEKTPLLHEMRRLMFDKGKMLKNFAIPYDDGIPPPKAFFTAVTFPIYKDVNLKVMFENPDKIPGEYWDLLESEGGVDKNTMIVPAYDKVPRLKWLFDPNIEWLKPKDFPPLDWSEGQVWPIDITREKMELMVEGGYDGSGKDILHYSCLADKKMGQEGKTIMLGTMPYKLPTE